MKKQKKYFPILSTALVAFLCASLYLPKLGAQAVITDGLNHWGYSMSQASSWLEGNKALAIQDDGKHYYLPFIGNKVDLLVPAQPSHPYLYILVRGGDGGSRSNIAFGSSHKVKGGGSASISAYLKIGTGPHELAPGDLLRFIVGRKADNRESMEANGGGGGAGSGLFLKKQGSDSWITLAVAGGGGGAFSDCCTSTSEGRSASLSPDGKEGGGINHTGGNGGTNGSDGHITSSGYGAEGGGIKGAFKNGEPIGSGDSWHFGCGKGGIKAPVGAGGGGYSGGGTGSLSASGGGGGSYFNSDMQYKSLSIFNNPKTYDPQDGRIEFKMTDDPSQQIRLVAYPDWCIDNLGAQDLNGNNIRLAACDGSLAQDWLPEGMTIKLTPNFNKCIDLNHSNTANGTNIQLYDCNGTSAQQWIYDGLSQNLRSHLDQSKCLALENGQVTTGANVLLWDCQESDSQKWTLEKAVTATRYIYNRIRYVKDPDKCFFVEAANPTDGSTVRIKECRNTISQAWYLDGNFIRFDKNRNMCLDLDQSGTANGTKVQLWQCNGTNAQKWTYDGLTRTFRSWVNPDKCIDVDHGSTADYTKIQLWDCNGTDAQRFEIY